jgi:phosphoenolpyruvate phosphomutase
VLQRVVDAKKTAYQEMLNTPDLHFLMESHTDCPRRFEEAGFEGIWASSFPSAQRSAIRRQRRGQLDQVLEGAEFMADQPPSRILLDGNSGTELQLRPSPGPKLNSAGSRASAWRTMLSPRPTAYIRSDSRHSADMEEFAGKIRAAKEPNTTTNFVVVDASRRSCGPRHGSEALSAAVAYCGAGADAILIHSKDRVPGDPPLSEGEWGDRLPARDRPDKYYTTPNGRLPARRFQYRHLGEPPDARLARCDAADRQDQHTNPGRASASRRFSRRSPEVAG